MFGAYANYTEFHRMSLLMLSECENGYLILAFL